MSRAREFADLAGSADAGGLTGRNLIINGAMQVWQRSEDNTTTSTGWAYRHADRYYTNKGRYRKETATFGGRQWDIMHIDDNSVGYNGGRGMIYKHEEYRDYADTLTLSFYAKASASSTVNVGASNFGGVSLISGQNVTLTTDWKRYDFQLTASSAPTQTGETYIINSLDDGVDYYITGIQLEKGDKATPFEHRSYADELVKCQRYYFETDKITGQVANSTNAIFQGLFPTEMRATPTVSGGPYTIWQMTVAGSKAQSSANNNADSNQNNNQSFNIQCGNFSGLSQYYPVGIASGGPIKFSSEL